MSQQDPGEGLDVARQELDELRERMAAVKEQAATEVEEKWTSPIRTKDLFDIKVKQKLANNDEYQALQTRIREAEARLAADSADADDSAATGG
ncbi:MAG TPA: HalX domain-containing protein [Pseudonocardiaceae bacterium]|nr:HalX domain-containing protein [Pseudonocardiaceae bacterium]